jgi:hypothetical protein
MHGKQIKKATFSLYTFSYEVAIDKDEEMQSRVKGR